MVKDGGGGILAGINPINYSETNPIVLFIIQVILIIVVTRAIHYLLIHFRQPRVISEVVGGILLGPSVFGRIPGFKDHIFPKASLVNLNLLATLGLILFLFIVGVELNPKLLLKNARIALTISAAGITLPFTLGIGVGYGLYKLMDNSAVSFVTFVLFSGVAMSITAFPVLARILSELQLLRTPVGITALTAGVGDDICAWVLLALVVSIINSTNSLNALYIFLMAVGWILVVIFAIRPILLKLVIKTGSENGPSLSMMAITLCLVLISSFVTDVIGVHAIFGGFIIGVIVPHEGGFALGMTEKIEDIVNVLFLPIYFTLSGLKTQIGLLNDARSWGWVFVVLFVAVFGKISGCTLAARFNKLAWRESFTIGVFMSCKGLVELIVLNIGLDAGIIDQKIFVIMVIMALVTTFMTTPLATYLYPHDYQRKMEIIRARENKESEPSTDSNKPEDGISTLFDSNKMLVVLNKVEYLPAMMTLVQLLQPPITFAPESSEKNQNKMVPRPNPLTVNVLRLIELTQRISAVMKFHETEETTLHDPIMNIFRSFGQLNLIKVKANLAVSPLHEFHQQVLEKAEDTRSSLVIIPWGGAGALIDDPSNPLEEVLGPRQKKETSPQVANFIQDSFHYITKVTNVAVFVDRGLGIVAEDDSMNLKALRVFLPFFGGVDDREALSFVIRLLEHPHVTIYVLRLTKSSKPTTNDVTITSSSPKEQIENCSSGSDRVQRPPLIHKMSTASGHVLRSKVERQASDDADDALLKQYLKNHSVISSNERISYVEVSSSTPLQTAVERGKEIVGSKDLVVLGRGRQAANLNHREEFLEIVKNLGGSFGNDTRKSLGDVAESFLVGGITASILVVQAKRVFDDDSKSISSNIS